MNKQYRAIFFLALFLCQNLQVLCETGNPESREAMKEAIESAAETHEFQAEIGRLMDIIINSLYTNKEVFLREVISNASDALDKIRFLAVADPSVLDKDSELAIRISYDPEAKTITIADTGIGMTKPDLINNLGTIAKSGTTNFVEALTKGQSLNLIGQFGVGFYSTFLAGNTVTVVTKNNNDDQYVWESSAAHSFTIRKDTDEDVKRGTKLIIHLKQDAHEFCDEGRLRSLIQKYSEFISFPIYLRVQKEVTREVVEEPTSSAGFDTTEEKKDDLEIKDEDEEKKPETKTVTEKVWEWELVNDNKAIWLRSKEDITTEDYNNFYKALSKDYADPLAHIHFNAEGEVEFKSILFVPGQAPSDMYENYYAKVSTLKLYVRRVLINEKFEELLPKYLNFIRGVIDSDDLPINVSRESLQQLKMLKVMGKKLVKKALEMLKKLAEAKEEEESDEEYEEEEEDEIEDKKTENKTDQSDDTKREEKEKKKQERIERYNRFWAEFGKNIKLGVIEDAANRNKLVQLTRWYTSRNTTELTSFDDYISRMKPNQEHIYYIGGESKEALMKHPAIQKLIKGGYEVVLLSDPVDEFCLQNVYDYEKKMLVNVGKGSFVMPTDDELAKKKLTKLKKMYSPLTTWWKNLMPNEIDEVTISERLVDDPCVVVGTVYGGSAFSEKITRAQAYGPSNPLQSNKRKLEINPGHPVIKELLTRVNDNPDEETGEMATLLYETALINSGFEVSDPRKFAEKFFKIFNPALGISRDAKVEEVEVEIDEEETAEPETITPVSGSSHEGMTEEIGPDSINIKFDEPTGRKNEYRESRDAHESAETPKEETRESEEPETREIHTESKKSKKKVDEDL